MPVSRLVPHRSMTRRTALATAPLLALGGCRWGPEADAPQAPQPQPDADAGIVREAAQAITLVMLFVQSVSKDHIGLSTPLAPLDALHTAHLKLLPAPGAITADFSDRTSAEDLAAVRRRETLLQAQLADLAGRAASGTFARALASMSASIAQHVAALPDPIGRGPA